MIESGSFWFKGTAHKKADWHLYRDGKGKDVRAYCGYSVPDDMTPVVNVNGRMAHKCQMCLGKGLGAKRANIGRSTG